MLTKMNYSISMSSLVVVIATIWMSVRVTMLEGTSQQSEGERWAILVAGSSGFDNYRHQADVCHAYQILKRGGLKDENIIVFMYDDIANNSRNPRPGTIINNPHGPDVYHGVPKDYTGNDVSAENFYAVLMGNKSALTGGSGKVLRSGPNDTVFIYYADHGGAGYIEMPDSGLVYGDDLVKVLKKKHAAKSYKKLVIYMEACEAGSLFEGILPNNTNIYVTTASNSHESSYGFYCPGEIPDEYTTCLGDLYSISWMEDSEKHDLSKETLKQQFLNVRKRALLGGEFSSHVMQYGDTKINKDFVITILGFNPNNVSHDSTTSFEASSHTPTSTQLVSQSDARLLHLTHEFEKASYGSDDKLKAQKELEFEISHRYHVDKIVHRIGDVLFGKEKSSIMMVHVRPPGEPLVDDWNCLKTLIKTYESHCGSLSTYGRKYSRAFANMCNAGISKKQFGAALLQACPRKNHVS